MLAVGWVETDPYGHILSCSAEAASMLNCSRRGSIGRDLLLFFPTHHGALTAALRDIRLQRLTLALDVSLRPKERKPVAATVQLTRTPSDTVYWVLSSDV